MTRNFNETLSICSQNLDLRQQEADRLCLGDFVALLLRYFVEEFFEFGNEVTSHSLIP